MRAESGSEGAVRASTDPPERRALLQQSLEVGQEVLDEEGPTAPVVAAEERQVERHQGDDEETHRRLDSCGCAPGLAHPRCFSQLAQTSAKAPIVRITLLAHCCSRVADTLHTTRDSVSASERAPPQQINNRWITSDTANLEGVYRDAIPP